MSTLSTGLGIDFACTHLSDRKGSRLMETDPSPSSHTLSDNSKIVPRILHESAGHLSIGGSHPTLRSVSSMKGLLLAEVGDSMVELDVLGGGSGFREGQCIALEATPGGGSRSQKSNGTKATRPSPHGALSRHGTLLSVGVSADRNAAELKSILGSSDSRLKPGAAVLPNPDQPFHVEGITALEQAKPKARVEIDIVLYCNTCVQGGYLRGHVKIHIRKRESEESSVMISGAKIRLIGFEHISNDRYPFYQCSAPLSSVTTASNDLYEPQIDPEGFARAKEGEHVFPFSMFLPLSRDHGIPKGALHTKSGVAIRYIAMASIKIKDSDTQKRSIAHFYRNCEIWPRLNPSLILASAPKPLNMSTTSGLFMGGRGKVDLTASIHRLHWIAGQQCYVMIDVTNATKKTINALSLALLRSTIVYKPDCRLDASHDGLNADPDACQTSTTQKQVAESILTMGRRGTRGHVSAKGWWTGVGPGEHAVFSHFILLPPDALSVTRSRLLEIEYHVQVTLSAGALPTADVQVTLPIRIVNFLSVDPPPSVPLTFTTDITRQPDDLDPDTSDTLARYISEQHHRHSRPVVTGLFDLSGSDLRPLESLAESEDEGRNQMAPEIDTSKSGFFEDAYTGIDLDAYDTDKSHYEQLSSEQDLYDLTMYEDDMDEISQNVIPPARIDSQDAPRFADLYYASIQEGLHQPAVDPNQEHTHKQDSSLSNLQNSNLPKQRGQIFPDLRPNARPPNTLSRPSRPRGPSSFAQRVQEKMEAAAAHNSSEARSEEKGLDDNHKISTRREETLDVTGSISNDDPRNSSYFSIRETLSQNEHVHENMPTENSLRAWMALRESSGFGYQPAHRTPPRTGQDTGSSAFSTVSATSGSRLLPRPPLPLSTSMDMEQPPFPPFDGIVGLPHNSWTGLAQLYNTQGTGVNAGSFSTRPSLMPPHSHGGSTSSVKDKIKELEERVKAAELI